MKDESINLDLSARSTGKIQIGSQDLDGFPHIRLNPDGTWDSFNMSSGYEFIPVGEFNIGIGKHNFGTWKKALQHG